MAKALGDRLGIKRYADALIPMDETLTRVAMDVSNRPYLIWKVNFTKPKLGEMDTELFKEWFQAFAQAAGITLHVENLYGENNHHIVESCFKGLARALRHAIEIDPRQADTVSSTKGLLERMEPAALQRASGSGDAPEDAVLVKEVSGPRSLVFGRSGLPTIGSGLVEVSLWIAVAEGIRPPGSSGVCLR